MFSDIQCVASFRNQNVSKANGVENLGQILDFLTRVKIRGRVGEICE